MSPMQSLVVRSLEDFFFAAPGTPSEDPLVTSVRRDAVGTRRFIASVGVFGAYMGALMCIVCSVFLAVNWSACSSYDRPLRWWVLLYVLLQACQLPVRVVLVVGLRNIETAGRSAEAFLTSLTASRAWKMGGIVGRLMYTWQVLGSLWWLNSESCPSCPGITNLIAAVLSTTLLRGVVVFVASRLLACGGQQNRRERARSEAFPEEEFPAVVSATSRQIKALPCVKFAKSKCQGFCTSCSICLSDFDDGETLKKLPCGHLFHDDCVGAWLQRNKRCPLCVRAIDDHCKAA